jgi:hypothetical protein
MAITESYVGMKWSVIDVLSGNNNYIVIIWILGEIVGGGYFFTPYKRHPMPNHRVLFAVNCLVFSIRTILWRTLISSAHDQPLRDWLLRCLPQIQQRGRGDILLHIVWSISTCPSLTRWDVESALHGSISPQCVAFKKLSRSNWIWLDRSLKNDLSILDLTIREGSVYDGTWLESGHPIFLEQMNQSQPNYTQTSGTARWMSLHTSNGLILDRRGRVRSSILLWRNSH